MSPSVQPLITKKKTKHSDVFSKMTILLFNIPLYTTNPQTLKNEIKFEKIFGENILLYAEKPL